MCYEYLMEGLMLRSRAMNPSRSAGDNSNGMELLRIFLSQNLIETRFVDKAGADRMPDVFLTSDILSMGYHSQR